MKVGLALGSGSARGWAHIGVLRALAQAGVEISCVSGTSIGSLVGGAFALARLDDLEAFVRGLDWKQIAQFLDVTFPRSGLIDGKKLTDFFRAQARKTAIEDLRVPYCAVATDLATGREVALDHGDLITAIRASISVPGVFTPVKRNGRYLVDGGLVNPVPVSVARQLGAEYVIAVDLNADTVAKRCPSPCPAVAPQQQQEESTPPRSTWKVTHELAKRLNELKSPALAHLRRLSGNSAEPNIFEVLTSSINIMEAQITTSRLAADPPDLLIQPQLGQIRFLEYHRAAEAIAEGHRATVEALQTINKG